MMQATLIEMEIDVKKMPLGKISKKQLVEGLASLNEIQAMLADKKLRGKTREQRLLGASNKFYVKVPTNFGAQGISARHSIDTEDKLKAKIELVESLLEMELAYKLSSQSHGSSCKVDDNYAKLHTAMHVVDRGDAKWKLLDRYLQNTHAATHSSYKLELLDLFEIAREGEAKKFAPFASDDNRALLWHGSRLTNWIGILSQGLRIAPPEAPVTGYMFGKGVYFADMSSKSANYCFTSPGKNEGLLMLCEVALGDLHLLTAADSSLPAGKPSDKLSVKGQGRTFPSPSDDQFLDGVRVPCGKPKEGFSGHTSLLYNEFIVYDTRQIQARYLLRVKFNYGR